MWTVFLEIILAVLLYTNIAIGLFFIFARLYGIRKFKADIDILANGIVNDMKISSLLDATMDVDESTRQTFKNLVDQYIDHYRIVNFKNQQHASMILNYRNESIQRRYMVWLILLNVITAALLIVLALLSSKTFEVLLDVFFIGIACAITEVAYFFLIHKRYIYIDSLGIKLLGKKMDSVLT